MLGSDKMYPNKNPVLYMICMVKKIPNAKKIKIPDLFLIAILTEAIKRIKIVIKIKEINIIFAVLTKRERPKREKRVRINVVEKKLNFVKKYRLLAAFFPLSEPYL